MAPHNLRERFIALIQREADHARAGRACGVRAKMNQLQDRQIIRELYLAAAAGVPMSLNVRGLCCLRAGVAGLSETIRVYSTLGRFLEHGRIYRFENGGQPEFFIGSADWMHRNLSRRMEAIAPVCDPAIRGELEAICGSTRRTIARPGTCSPTGPMSAAGRRRASRAAGPSRSLSTAVGSHSRQNRPPKQSSPAAYERR